MKPEDMVVDVSKLVSLPQVCFRVHEMIDQPDSTAKSIGEVVSHDPNLASQLLRIVNSPYYGFSSHISTLSHAIAIIGMEELRSLVLAASAAKAFANIPQDMVDMETFWHHSVYCALVARNLTERSGGRNRERMFVAGLLHDVGRLVLYYQAPEVARRTIEGVKQWGRRVYELEQQILGFSHAEIGAALLQNWGLPRSLWEPIKYHHDPQQAEQFQPETLMLYLSNAIASTVEPGSKWEEWSVEDLGEELDPKVWELTGMNETVVREAIGDANLQSFEVLEIIAPNSTLIY